ncbi:Regulation of nuclear pre-mRNA like protein [Argiope bruennichi]|uniref:Regulation of nuclear pre-mRNA like protein n=1 Tax=Argiope bruennichi TaxID=94029 RepID=A0A8T0ECD7_ARGBR|nr:Regulation of nuclear pre-mRNA like protein [Argiope bruennichi]
MPRELDIEKLERKFSSLTKSKESIRAVSSWIIHHSEFYKEIVEQWYIALTKGQNALLMFFVVNEIIHYSGNKTVPRFKEAFSKVLEKAVCLEKVKKIKSDVCYMFNLWRERNMFEDDFLKKLETKLNGAEVTSLLSAAAADDDYEISTRKIIYNYKSQNLFDSLRKLTAAEAEAKEKIEVFLKFADELKSVDLNNFTDLNECQKILKVIDTFQSLVEDCLKAADNESEVRKNVVKELEHSSVFYNAQYGDVKKASNAYMTYGKKLKNMERMLFEKKLTLLSQSESSSPCFSESNTCTSPITCTFPFDHDNASVSRTSSKISLGSIKEKGQSTMLSPDNVNNSISSWNEISSNTLSSFPKNCEKSLEETFSKRVGQAPNQNLSKLAQIFAEIKPNSEKQIRPKSALTGISNLNVRKEDSGGLQIAVDQQIKVPKNIELISAAKSSNQETIISDLLTKKTLNKKEQTENGNEIEILFEKSFDTKKAKSNTSIKRKMEPFQEEEIPNINKRGKFKKVSNIFMPSSKAMEKYKEIDFLNNRSDTQDSLSINNETSWEVKTRNNRTVIPEFSFNSESNFSLQTPLRIVDSSSSSSTSIEFLKHIPGKNKSSPSPNVEDNCVTDASAVKDYIEAGKLLENEDSENVIKNPSHNSKYSEQFASNEQEIPFIDTKLPKLAENDEKMSSPISNVQLESKDQLKTGKADEKPNLLQGLEIILEGFANKSIFNCDFKKALKDPPIIPLENCLILYHILSTFDKKHANNSSPSSSQNIVPSKTISESAVSSEIHSQDNLEVMDMECDSD